MRTGYTIPARGIEEKNRALLTTLHRRLHGPFNAHEASVALSLGLPRTRRLLSYLANRGWLTRVKRGLYITVPLDASHPGDWREDTWIVAAKSFSPCYIGGWTACEHWGLTEQIFRHVVVFTGRTVRRRRTEIQGTPFLIRTVRKELLFGTRWVWRGKVRVEVSDPSRTLVDLLNDPAVGGGIGHTAEILAAYFTGEFRDEKRLVEYALRFGNRTIFKRLGYLLEAMGIGEETFLRSLRKHVSKGLSSLDPSIDSRGKIVKRWNLRVNARIDPARGPA